MMPNWSSSSMAVLATSCISEAETTLPIELSGPGVWPRERAVKVSERKVKLLEEREAKAKADASKPKLTPEEKQARYREILGMEE